MTEAKANIIAEGKTKIIHPHVRVSKLCIVESKDDITARDDPKYTRIIPGKGALNTRTARNIFRLLKRYEIPVAYIGPSDDTAFLAEKCDMFPLEVVVRREAFGSFLERYPDIERGTRLHELKCEFFLKTSGRRWRDIDLPCDDPLIMDDIEHGQVRLFNPHKPVSWSDPIAIVRRSELSAGLDTVFSDTQGIALDAFEVQEEAFAEHGVRLVDQKTEFGLNQDGDLRLADVITADECRLLIGDDHYDKQAFREGKVSLDEVKRRYEVIADITDTF